MKPIKIEGRMQFAGSGRFQPFFLPEQIPFVPGTPKPEDHYALHDRLGAMLGIPTIQCYVEVEARDSEGQVTHQFKDRSRTFVRNWFNLVFGTFTCSDCDAVAVGYVDGSLVMRSTAGANAGNPGTGIGDIIWNAGNSIGWTRAQFGNADATLGTNTAGIVIGTGIIPENFNSHKLATQIANGNGSGQMVHTLQNANVRSFDYGTRVMTCTIQRIFNNNSGAPIIVTETGIYAFLALRQTNTTCMLIRDLLAASVTVPNAGQLTVTYTLQMAFPANVVENPPVVSASGPMSPATLRTHLGWWAAEDLWAGYPAQPRVQRFKRG